MEIAPSGAGLSAWPKDASGSLVIDQASPQKPSQRDALQGLLAFSALHDQIRRRRALASRHGVFDSTGAALEFEPAELFVLDEVLQLVAERAVAITGADGLAIALAESNEIVLRASAGNICPDPGTRIDRDSAFSGACFRNAQTFICDDTETDQRVNLHACRKLGARSMVAVPLCGRRRVIGVLEAFSSWPFAFNEIDVRNLSLLAELVLAALKPEDEDRFAQSAQVAATTLETPRAQVLKAEPKPAMTPSATIPASAPKISAPPTTVAAPQAPKPIAPVESPKAGNPPISAARVFTPPVVKSPAPEPQKPVQPQVTVPAPRIPTAPFIRTTPSPQSQKPVDLAPKSVTTPLVTAAPVLPPVTPTSKPVEAPKLDELKKAETKKEEQKKEETKDNELTKSAAPVEPTAAEPALEPVLTFGQSQAEESNRPWLLVMLVGTVIAAAFIAGVWWKLKTAQIGSQMVQNKPQIEQPVAPATPPPTVTSTPSAGTSSAETDTLSDNQPEDTPATPQELSKFPRVSGVRHWSSADSSTVVLDLEDQVQYEPGHLPNPERFYFDLRDTQLAAELQGKSFEGDALLSHIRIAQPVSGMTRIVLEARATSNLSTPQVSLERDPYRLVIQVSKNGATPKTAVNLFPTAPEAEKAKLAIVVPAPTKEDLALRARVSKMRIVVDAGHGGWDLGTVGRRGLLEKDLVLEIAERLGKLLESRLGAEVIYTRQDDNYIPLDDRAVLANQAKADLFISVHANYSDLPSARGVETYYTNFFSAPGTKDLPANPTPKEAAMRSMPKNIPTPTLTPVELHDRIEQSQRLANSVQRSLYGTLSVLNPGLRDRGIKEAGFVVLTESAMPGILAEVSFVSSPKDEQKLRSDGYREQIAEALYRGIARYAAAKGVKIASTSK
jgi:N-acetylmuramoyl-L-alanine amidase/putative methionine-R-sulfoxide reductase with GAF domain